MPRPEKGDRPLFRRTSAGIGPADQNPGSPRRIPQKCGGWEFGVGRVGRADGGFQMTLQELGTIMQYDIPVKILVLNNSFLGMVRQWQGLFHDKRYSSTEMSNPDFVKLVEAYGIRAKKVDDRKDLIASLNEMLNSKKAFFLDIKVGKEDNVFPMVPAGAGVADILLEKAE